MIVAAIYAVVWPKPADAARPRPRSKWEHLVLRWFHMLVWLSLAASCFLRLGLIEAAGMADLLAWLALVLYGIFLFVLARERAAASRASKGESGLGQL